MVIFFKILKPNTLYSVYAFEKSHSQNFIFIREKSIFLEKIPRRFRANRLRLKRVRFWNNFVEKSITLMSVLEFRYHFAHIYFITFTAARRSYKKHYKTGPLRSDNIWASRSLFYMSEMHSPQRAIANYCFIIVYLFIC